MSKALSILMLALVFLGFLISTTMNMYNDMEQMRAENQKLARELTQIQSAYEILVKEKDALVSENAGLNLRINALQNVYEEVNKARLRAEAEAASYQNMVANISNNVQTKTPPACTLQSQQSDGSEKFLVSSIIPIGAGSLITLVMVGLALFPSSRPKRKSILDKLPHINRA